MHRVRLMRHIGGFNPGEDAGVEAAEARSMIARGIAADLENREEPSPAAAVAVQPPAAPPPGEETGAGSTEPTGTADTTKDT